MSLNQIYDRLELCIQMDYPSFTDFLDLSVLSEVRQKLKVPKGYFKLEYCGFLDDERRMIGFFPDSYMDMIGLEECKYMFPAKILLIKPSFDSDQMFEHKDLLGTVLGLGLERKLFGDIIINDRQAYMVCHERGAGIVLNELVTVRHTNITSNEVLDPSITQDLSPRAKELNVTIASLRLDGVVKAISNCSRNEANTMINTGYVKVNQVEISKNHKHIEEGDILSIRRKGKFKIKTIGQLTKKGRVPITVLKYI